MWSRLLVPLLISLVFISAKATTLVGQMEALDSLASTLENILKEHVDYEDSADRHRHKEINNGEMDTKARARRSSTYGPYTSNPYDLGPIGQCSVPQLDACNFPNGYTVPEYMARTVNNYNDMLSTLKSQLRNLDGSSCANSMTDFLCKETIAPQCISNTTVRYPSNVQAKCERATSFCTRFRSASPTYCSSLGRNEVVGDFSLTKCRVPKVTGCNNVSPSPDWIVGRFEHVASESSLEDRAESVNLVGDCKEKYMRLACTRPTCRTDGRLQGYRDSSQCHNLINCVSDTTVRNSLAQSLQCNSVDKLRQPSRSNAKSAYGTYSYREKVVGYFVAVLLVNLFTG